MFREFIIYFIKHSFYTPSSVSTKLLNMNVNLPFYWIFRYCTIRIHGNAILYNKSIEITKIQKKINKNILSSLSLLEFLLYYPPWSFFCEIYLFWDFFESSKIKKKMYINCVYTEVHIDLISSSIFIVFKIHHLPFIPTKKPTQASVHILICNKYSH